MNLVNPVTGERIGPVVTAYGWLFPGYAFGGCLNDCSYWTWSPG